MHPQEAAQPQLPQWPACKVACSSASEFDMQTGPPTHHAAHKSESAAGNQGIQGLQKQPGSAAVGVNLIK